MTEDKFDFKIVDSPHKNLVLPESLCHQIGVQKDYLNGIIHGNLSFESGNDKYT